MKVVSLHCYNVDCVELVVVNN